MRRTILIILAVLILVGILAGIYFFFFANKNTGVVIAPDAPFGTSGNFAPPVQDIPVGQGQQAGEEVAPRFLKIANGPIATGLALVTSTTTLPTAQDSASTTPAQVVTETKLRFIERVSGNIYEYNVRAKILTRITNQTLPGIVSASWTTDGARAFVQYLPAGDLNTIETYALGENEADGFFLETGLSEVLVDTKNTVLTLLPNSSGSIATTAKTDGTNVRTLFSSPLSALRVIPFGTNYVAYTKASESSDGYGFQVDSTSGSFTRIAGPLRGLTMLPSPSGKTVLMSYRSGNAQTLALLDVDTAVVTQLPVATLSEKCVWRQDGSAIYCAVPRTLTSGLPDAWYQGALSFSDRIWRIDVEGRVATLVIDPRQLAEVEIDAVSLTLDTDASMLSFIDRNDGSLWLYDL